MNIQTNLDRPPRTIVVAGNRHILLNALNACRHYGLAPQNCILVITSESIQHFKQVVSASSKTHWHSTYSLLMPCDDCFSESSEIFGLGRIRGLSFLRLIRNYKRLLNRLFSNEANNAIENIITGFYAEPMERAIHGGFPNANYILVDDGNLTPAVNQRRLLEKRTEFRDALISNTSSDTSKFGYRVKLRLLTTFAKIPRTGARKITFFTNFDFETSISKDKHTSCPVRIANEQSTSPRLVHFLGLPGISRNIFSQSTYTKLLKSLRIVFADHRLEYFSHPAETSRDLDLVREFLCPAKIEVNQLPYDVAYNSMSEIPMAITGFHTSTFIPLTKISGIRSRLIMLKVPLANFACQHRIKRVSTIYNDFSLNPQIECIHLDESPSKFTIKGNSPLIPIL